MIPSLHELVVRVRQDWDKHSERVPLTGYGGTVRERARALARSGVTLRLLSKMRSMSLNVEDALVPVRAYELRVSQCKGDEQQKF